MAGTPSAAAALHVDGWIRRAASDIFFQVDNPPRPPVQCQTFDFAWRGNAPPFVFSVLSGQSPHGTLEQFGGIGGPSYQWSADIAAGTVIIFQISDGTGASVQTAPLTIQAGSDSSCLASANDPQPQPSNSPSPTETPVQHSSSTPAPSSTPSGPSGTSSASPISSDPGSTPSTHTSSVSSGDDPTPNSGGAEPTNSSANSQGRGQTSGTAATPAGSHTVSSSSDTGGPHSLAGTSADSALSGGPATATTTSTPSAPGAPGSDPSPPTPTLQSGGEHHMDAGAIIGLVCGVVAFLVLLTIIFLCRRRRRRHICGAVDLERSAHPVSFVQRTSENLSASQKHAWSHAEEDNAAELEQTRKEEPTKTSQLDVPANRLSMDVEPPTPLPFSTQPSDPLTPSCLISEDSQALSLQSSVVDSQPLDTIQPHVTREAGRSAACGTSCASMPSKTSEASTQPSSRRRTPEHESLIARQPVHDTDGGVRLAGGPIGEEMDLLDDASYSAPSLLPPPYSRY
ncbi:hypothetical protein C8Q73DRAFT_785701 [Cubamyces lactineus]|nr:hypothetical protein C8Q73DRAFT_785701 [Cubamyces lactineus]